MEYTCSEEKCSHNNGSSEARLVRGKATEAGAGYHSVSFKPKKRRAHMRVVVIGAGGTGGYFGGLLARAGEDVTFLARGSQLEALRTHGLTVKSRLAGTFSLPVHATSDPQEIGPVDLVLFCVKTYDTWAAIEGLHLFIGPETVVLPIQNGIDAAERLSREVGVQHLIGAAA